MTRTARVVQAVLVVAAFSCGGGGNGSGADAGADATVTDIGQKDTIADSIGNEGLDRVTVMTFNVLCSFCDPAYDPWEDRLGYQADIIARHDPDLIGLQEFVFASEVDEYLAQNPGYAAVYYVSDDPSYPMPSYPDETILYRKDRFEVLDSGYFWLSPTPDDPFTIGFGDGGQLWRLVGWVLMEQKADGRRFYFANTHFDPNHPSQEKSGPLVYDRFEQMVSSLPFIFTGDFNTHPGEEGYDNLAKGVTGHDWHFTNSFDVAKDWEILTNQAATPAYDVDSRIDHVWTAGGKFECSGWRVDMHVYGAGDRYPSDHFAISADLKFPPL